MDRAEQAKQVDLRDVIQLEGEKSHGNYKSGWCPFHESGGEAAGHRQPSFLVYAGNYRCLSSSCGKSGNIFNWYAYKLFGDDQTSLKNSRFVEVLNAILNEPNRPQRPKGRIVKLAKANSDEDVNLHRLAKAYYKNLIRTPERLTYFMYRGFTMKTVKQQMWGWDGQHYAITVWAGKSRESDLLSIRLRSKDKDGLRYSGIRGNNQKMLYNREALLKAIDDKADFVLVVYGEFDAALAYQDGIYAVSPTNGAKSLDPEWFTGYTGNVVIMPDKGEEADGYSDARFFEPKGWVYKLPKGDFKDYTAYRQQGGDPAKILSDINKMIYDVY